MNKNKKKIVQRDRRRARVRAKVAGTKSSPRLSVFKSNTGLYMQLIDDNKGITLVSAHSREIKLGKLDIKEGQGKKIAVAFALGELIAKKAKDKKITEAVFDRGGYKYHGRIRAAAEGARAGGLKF